MDQEWQYIPLIPYKREVKTRGMEVQGQPCLHRKFEASLGYVRPCPKYQQPKPNKEKGRELPVEEEYEAIYGD